jgi:hypothetical protein
MRTLLPLAASALLLLLPSARARAELQTRGPEVFPGKLEASLDPAGFQAGFRERTPTGYKLHAEFAGQVAPVNFGGVWLGGGLTFAHGTNACFVVSCGEDFGLWLFVMLTFEKLIPIPLVPFVRAGIGGDVLFYDDIAGALAFRVGGGAHYYLLRWLGIGLQTNFTVGPGFYPRGVGSLLYGHWDFGTGVRFNF